MPIITLQSANGKIFRIDAQILKCPGAIKTMLEEGGMEDGGSVVILLPRVNSAILRKVLQWANYHKYDAQPPLGEKIKKKGAHVICPWDNNFLKVDQDTMLGLMSAGNYLEIKELLEVICKKMATRIIGMSYQEIRRTLIHFLPAQEDQENESCEQK